ncbi:MAG: cob(I)yrinic acid a,c-diamide adenosyltransferase [Rickettsiales bacterium]
MVKINKIYTKTGDDGQTGLADGSRRAKFDLRVKAYGTVDEANSSIGMARLYIDEKYDKNLFMVQNDLFDLGADLSTPHNNNNDKALRIAPSQTERLEHEIDSINANISPLTSFVLPAGGQAAAYLHMARCVVRRAERISCELSKVETINNEVIKYLNRLSDLLFVLARASNNNGKADILWIPAANR